MCRGAPSFRVTNAAMAWPLISWVRPMTAASATAGMVHQSRLHLHRADVVARDQHDVVHAAQQPVVAFLVAPRAVAGEVVALVGKLAPVDVFVALVVAPERSQHGRPGLGDDEDAGLVRAVRQRLARLRPRLRRRCRGTGGTREAGLVVLMPGSGVIIIAPVSVCHQVSTIGQRPPPMCLWYHSQASGLIGSPTEPKRRRLDRSCLAGQSVPHFINARMAVGAVYRMVMPYFSIRLQKRSRWGQSGAPS